MKITLEKAFNLVETCSAVILNDDVLVYPALDEIRNDPLNEWMFLAWENEDGEFRVRFSEEQGENCPRVEDGKLILIDEDGEEASLVLLETKPMDLQNLI